MSDVAKIRGMLGLSQQGVADAASVTRTIITEVERKHKGLSVAASLKAAPVLGAHPGVLYLGTQLAAIKAKLEEEEITEDVAADKLLRVLRTVLEKFDDIEDQEEAEALITSLEELLTETTGNTIETVKGSKGVATKNAGVHAAFIKSFDFVGTGVRPEDYEVDDHRDLNGVKLDSRNLRDDAEGIAFEDPSLYGEANIPGDYDDEDLEGRDPFTGRRVRPMRGR